MTRSAAVVAASMALMAVSLDGAYAGGLCPGDWRRCVEALTQPFLFSERSASGVLTPPGDIDQGMVIAPPKQGRMRVVVPPETPRARS